MIVAAELAVRCSLEAHERQKADEATWSELRFIGILDDVDDDGRAAPLALANCACGSTLARRATPDEVTRWRNR